MGRRRKVAGEPYLDKLPGQNLGQRLLTCQFYKHIPVIDMLHGHHRQVRNAFFHLNLILLNHQRLSAWWQSYIHFTCMQRYKIYSRNSGRAALILLFSWFRQTAAHLTQAISMNHAENKRKRCSVLLFFALQKRVLPQFCWMAFQQHKIEHIEFFF